MLKVDISKQKLLDLYKNQKLSIKKIAEYFNCSIWTIQDRLQRFALVKRYKGNIYTLTALQKEVLDGIMLGDGCLTKHNRCSNENAQLVYLSKSEQHVKFVGQYFENLLAGEGYTYRKIYDKRTEKYYEQNKFRTIHCTGLTEQYKRWYPNGKKIIPDDLVLTPLKCLMWYIGDGGLVSDGQRRSQSIKLSTQGFTKVQQENILLPQLIKFNARLQKVNKAKDGHILYGIYIPHKSIQDFLSFIGECPFSDYLYKWSYKKFKNKIPEISHKVHETEFCQLFKQGLTYYAIGKHYGIEPNAVRYYLEKHGLYQRKDKNAF